MEEKQRYNNEISRMKLDHEKKLADLAEKTTGMEESERRILLAKEKVLGNI